MKTKINFTLNPESGERIEYIRQVLGRKSVQDVATYGLALIDLIFENEQDGGKIQFVDKNGKIEDFKLLKL